MMIVSITLQLMHMHNLDAKVSLGVADVSLPVRMQSRDNVYPGVTYKLAHEPDSTMWINLMLTLQ